VHKTRNEYSYFSIYGIFFPEMDSFMSNLYVSMKGANAQTAFFTRDRATKPDVPRDLTSSLSYTPSTSHTPWDNHRVLASLPAMWDRFQTLPLALHLFKVSCLIKYLLGK